MEGLEWGARVSSTGAERGGGESLSSGAMSVQSLFSGELSVS